MNDFIKLLTSQEIIIVYVVAGIACFLYFIIYLIDKSYYKRKQKQNTKELNRLVDDINSTLELEKIEVPEPVQLTEEESSVYVEPVLVENIETPTVEAVVKEEPVVEPIEIKEEVKEVEKIEPVIIENKEEQLPVENIVEEISENVEDLVLDTMEIEPAEEEITYTSIEPTHEEAQEELRRLTEELEKAEEETKNIDLTSYEEAQERDAIISLDELIKKSKEMYANNELTQYEDEGNEPISLADLEAKMKQVAAIEEEPVVEYAEPVIEPIIEKIEETPVVEQMVLDDFDTVKVEREKRPVYQESFKYKPSPIISPIYGIEKTKSQNDLELENTANYEKLDEEIKKTNDFIMTLKDLQKHLD